MPRQIHLVSCITYMMIKAQGSLRSIPKVTKKSTFGFVVAMELILPFLCTIVGVIGERDILTTW
jgi:hypothetical protein